MSLPLSLMPPRMRFSLALVVLLALLPRSYSVVAQANPIEIASDEAEKHLTKKVKPTTPELAIVAHVNGAVAAVIVVAANGTVKSVSPISGPPMLAKSAADAINQWRFTPFMNAGQPVEIRTRVEVYFELSKEEQTAHEAYFPLEDDCRMSLNAQNFSQAETACAEAVELSKSLEQKDVFERSNSYSLLGHALLLQGKIQDAIPQYSEALAIDQKGLKSNDADLASNYGNLAHAYFRLGELNTAEPLYLQAEQTLEAAIADRPDKKEEYTRRLKNLLTDYSQLKRAMGDIDAADRLANKAGKL